MGSDTIESISSAINDFHRARSRANLKEIIARISGESIELFSYEEVRQKLKIMGSTQLGLNDVPLDAIIGSMGRYSDFTRGFLPRQSVDQDRWARVKITATGLVGYPPIDVYKIGEAYFVKDGNHRVSVARSLGATSIQAYVTEIRTRAPLSREDKPDDLIILAEYADFLEQTKLDELFPEADLKVTIPGQYPVLKEHIDVHRYFMGINQQRDIPYEYAVKHWYETVYSPVMRGIREMGVLRDFPNRTEADLYLWISKHRAKLEKELGWLAELEPTISDLVEKFGHADENIFKDIGKKMLNLVSVEILDKGPPVGKWRKEKITVRDTEKLFSDILVPISGDPTSWVALEQSLIIAQREESNLFGLHIVDKKIDVESHEAQTISTKFDKLCREGGINGRMLIESGGVSNQICSRARFTDLIVTALSHPPGNRPKSRFFSGFRSMIQTCPRPILATPNMVSELSRALLAYDGSPKADEALFIATYLAENWNIPLVVIYVREDGETSPQPNEKAEKYLISYNIKARYITTKGPISDSIINTARDNSCDLLIMGGYGANPVKEVVLGSVVDEVLRKSQQPTLICR